MATQPSRVVIPRAKQPRFKVATDENAATRPRLVNMTAKGPSFLDRKKPILSQKPSVATTQRNALGEIHNVRKKEPLKEKENVPSSKLPGATIKDKDTQSGPAPAPAGLKRRRSPSLHAATARPARIPNPPPGAATVSTTTTTITTTTVRSNTTNNENRNSLNLDAPPKAPAQAQQQQQQQQQPPRRLGRMLQAINRRQSQVLPPRPSAPVPSSTKATNTNTTQKHTSVPFPSTEAPSSVRRVSREIPSSVLPSSRPPSPVPPSELPQDEDEDSEANLATETDDSTVVISTRKPSVSEPKSAIKLEKKDPVERDPVKAFEEMKEGDWLYAPAEKRAEYKAYVERVAANFVDEPELEDATMVSEYAEEIFAYMSKLEEESMPMPDYMNGQQEIDWEMRSTLIDWLLQVHLRYHMLPETLWIAVNIIDRFLSRRVVSVVKLQLVGVTAMFVAAKYEEIIAPSVEEYVKMTGGGYKKEEILKGEKIILQTIDFRISSYCSPYSWVRRISKADDYDLKTRTLCKFLIELTLLDWRFLRVKPSMIAAIGMYSARRMLGQDWNDAFVFYSGKVEEELLMGYEFILEALIQPDFDKQYIFKKYRSKRFLRAAIYAREWALQYWGLPSSVHIGILSAEEEMVEEVVVDKRPRTDSHRSSIYSVGE